MREWANPSVGAVILAAGSSSRLGTPKQSVRFQGIGLLRRTTVAALEAGCRPVVVVTGANADVSRSEIKDLDAIEVLNEEWEDGIGTSVRAGVDALRSIQPSLRAAVLLVCDQPHITSNVVSRLVIEHDVTDSPIIASTYGGSFGVPALFSRSLFPELVELDGDVGAKYVIKKHTLHARFLPFADGEVDVDTEEDVARLYIRG